MLVPIDVRLVKPMVASPLGNLDGLWSALLDSKTALCICQSISPTTPVASMWSGKDAGKHVIDTEWHDGLTDRDVSDLESTLHIEATTKGIRSVVRPLWQRGYGHQHPSRVVSNACASGSVAVIEAVDALTDDEFESVVVLALDGLYDFIVAGFNSLEALSAFPAKPFDRNRSGLSLGDAGAEAFLRINTSGEYNEFPRIISYGCSNDANHISGPSRDGSGLALAIERALDGIDKSEIRAICAHGTATEYNDAMEARAFHTVFDGSPPPVFGIKGAIGHTLGAAGLIEVIVSAKVATEGVIPPTVGFEHGEEDFPLDVVHGQPRKIKPGYVLTTNSGFGGMNTAIVIGPGEL